MRIAPIHTPESIQPPKRIENEGLPEYIDRCGLDPVHLKPILDIYEHWPTRNAEVVIAHVVALYAAIQDLFYFHETPLDLGPVIIRVRETNATKRFKKRFRVLDIDSPSFMGKRTRLVNDAHKHLVALSEKYSQYDSFGNPNPKHQRFQIDKKNRFRSRRETAKVKCELKRKKRNQQAYRLRQKEKKEQKKKNQWLYIEGAKSDF